VATPRPEGESSQAALADAGILLGLNPAVLNPVRADAEREFASLAADLGSAMETGGNTASPAPNRSGWTFAVTSTPLERPSTNWPSPTRRAAK